MKLNLKGNTLRFICLLGVVLKGLAMEMEWFLFLKILEVAIVMFTPILIGWLVLSRLDVIKSRLDGIESRLDRIESKLDGIERY